MIAANGARATWAAGEEAEGLGFRPRDRLTVASALLHGADVSCSARPWTTCRVWVLRLLEEFEFQAEQVRSVLWRSEGCRRVLVDGVVYALLLIYLLRLPCFSRTLATTVAGFRNESVAFV